MTCRLRGGRSDRLSYRGGGEAGTHCPHSGSTVSVRGNRTEGTYPPVADCARPDTAGGLTVRCRQPVSSAPPIHWSGEPSLTAKPNTSGGMYPSRLSVSDERRLRESNPAMHGFAAVANPVGVIADGVLSARWGGRRLPCLTGRFRYGGKQKNRHVGIVVRHTCPSRRERRNLVFRMAFTPKRKRGWAFRSGIGVAPRRGFEPRRTVPKTGVLPLHQRGIAGRADGC